MKLFEETELSNQLRESNNLLKQRRVPRAHVCHIYQNIKCGCVTDLRDFSSSQAVCINCGATYDWMEVVSFNVFHCYDCHGTKYQVLENRANYP